MKTLLNQTNVVWEVGETLVIYSASIINHTDYKIIDAAGFVWSWGRLTYRESRKVKGVLINLFYDNFTLSDISNPGTWKVELVSNDEYNIGYRSFEIRVYKPSLTASISSSSNTVISGSGFASGAEEWTSGEAFLVDPGRLVVEEDFHYPVSPGLSVTSVTLLNRIHGIGVFPRARVIIYNNQNRSLTLEGIKLSVHVAGETSTGMVRFEDLGEPSLFEGYSTRAYLFVFGFFNETPLIRVYSGITGRDANVSMTPITALRYYYRPKLIRVELTIGGHSRELPFLLYDPWGIVRGKLIEYAPIKISEAGSFNFDMRNIDILGSRELTLYVIAYDNNFITAINKVYSETLDLSYTLDKNVVSGEAGENKSITITITSMAKRMTLSFTLRLLYGSRDYKKASVISEQKVTIGPGKTVSVTFHFKMPKPVEGVPAVLMIYSPDLDRMFRWVDLQWKEKMIVVLGGQTLTVPQLITIEGLPSLELNLAILAVIAIIILAVAAKAVSTLVKR